MPCTHDVGLFWTNIHSTADVVEWILKYALFVVLLPATVVGLVVVKVVEHRRQKKAAQSDWSLPQPDDIINIDGVVFEVFERPPRPCELGRLAVPEPSWAVRFLSLLSGQTPEKIQSRLLRSHK